MLKTLKQKFITLLLMLASLFMLAGCGGLGTTLDDVIDMYDLTARVTYYANGGRFEGSESKIKKEMYYKAGSKAINIGGEGVEIISGTISIDRDNYEFGGWYYAVFEEGETQPKQNTNGDYEYGEPVDFSVTLQEGDHWHIIAKWNAKEKLNVYLSTETTITYDGQQYENGDLITSYNFGAEGAVSAPTLMPFQGISGYTYLDYYYDEAATQPVEWPHVNPNNGQDSNIYVRYIEGDWKVLRSASEVQLFFANGMGTASNHYCLSRDLDLDGKVITLGGRDLSASLNGLGFTIKNFVLERKNINANSKVAVFGEIKATANLSNVNFVNVEVRYSLRSGKEMANFWTYLICNGIQEGAILNGVTFDAVMSIEAHENSNLVNMPKEDEVYADTNWKFGGFDTDAAFSAVYTGITVTAESTFEVV